MNYIDIIICIPLVWGLYKGFTKGLIVEAASIVAFALGVWGGIHFSKFVAGKLSASFNWQSEYLHIISFALTFLAIVIIIFLIAKIVQRLVEGMALSAVNKIGGALFGSLKFAFILSVAIFIIDAIEKSYPMFSFEAKQNSLLYKPIGKIAPTVIPALNNTNFKNILPSADDMDIDVDVKAGLKEKEE